MRHALNKIPLFFIMIYLFSSCRSSDENNIKLLTVLNQSLVTSSQTIESNNKIIYDAFASKAADKSTMEKAKTWQPKALMIKSLSDNTYNYIEQLKKELKEQAGARIENQKEIFDKDNRNAATVIFNKSGKALFKKLTEYRTLVLETDPELRNKFERTIPFDTTALSSEIAFKNAYFKNLAAISALSTLSCFQNKIRNTENMLIYYCYNNVGSVKFTDVFPIFLVNQSSSAVKKGEPIIITAGIGIFSTEGEPVFSIAGKKVLPKSGDQGYVVYKLKAASSPGKYNVPIKLAYTQPDGTKAWQEKEITYEVVKDSGD